MKLDIVFKESGMGKINSSPEKGKFQINSITKQIESLGEDPKNEELLQSYLDVFSSRSDVELTEGWGINNMEHDLRSTQWICDKAKASETYSQNLYAAICNNEFAKTENTWDILKENFWSASWRSAGGIVADMREEGDYIDWYCSGMGDRIPDQVPESSVTDEIRADLKTLGWLVIKNDGIDI